MLRSLTNVIFGFVAFICLLAGLFMFWFLYNFSLRWAKYDGVIPPDANVNVVFGTEGAWWIGLVAAGWIVMAVVFWMLHRRANKASQVA